jgi:type II secretory pathway pseudopilin PulG
MDIYIKRDDGQFGPFSPEQIEGCLASGALVETDIAWHAALPDWVPVTEVLATLDGGNAPAPLEKDASAKASPVKKGGSKKLLVASVAAVVVLGAAAAVLVPKFLGDQGGKPPSENQPEKIAGTPKTNAPSVGVPDRVGNTNALSVPLAPNGPSSTSFEAVTQHLDTGGSFYFYLSTDEAQGWVRSGFDEGGKLLEQFGPMLGEENAGQAAMGFAAAKAFYKGVGLDAIDGIGASTRSLGDGLKRNVAMLHRDPAKGDGILWKALGTAPHDLDGLSLMPADTVYAIHGDLDLAAILAWVKTMVATNQPAEVMELLAHPPVQQALGAYAGEVGIYVTLDFQKLHKIPMPEVESTLPGAPSPIPTTPGEGVAPLVRAEDGMEIPEPGLVLTIKVNNGDLLAMLQGVAESMGMTLAEVDIAGVKAHQFPAPLPVPGLPEMIVQPVVFQSGGYLILTSSPALAANVIATQADPDTGLRGTAEFKKLTKGMELKGNQFTFMSGQVAGLYGNILKQGMAAEAAMLPESVQNQIVRLMTLGMSGQVTVLQVLPEGFLVRTHTEGMGYDSAVLAVGAVVPVAVVAALVLPAIQNGRSKAREVQSMNNLKQLGVAIHAFHADNDQLPDAAKWSDALLPIVGNEKAVFISYAFNKKLSGVKLDALREAARTVVFFESDLGWNGAGGIDDVFTLNDNYLIGFADGHVERVSGEDLDKLNWTP